MGCVDLKSTTGKEFAIESFIPHEGYKASTRLNDIAVVKLATFVAFNNPRKIRPACLWAVHDIDQTKTVASGEF